MTHQQFLRIKPGRLIVIVEKFGQPFVDRRVVRKITESALITAPVDDINAESIMKVTQRTFKTLKESDQFGITSDLGKVIVRAMLVPEPTTTKKG